MKHEDLGQRLSRISTVWTVLRAAHEGPPELARAAQEQLLQRYGRAVHRYLLAVVRDPHTADELTQEFALALVRGSFRHADPERGRFRAYLKTALFHLVSRYRRDQARLPRQAPAEGAALDNLAAPGEDDRRFNEGWRDELLGRCWDALAQAHPAAHAVLRFRADNPDLPSHEVARRLAPRLGKALTAESVRQALRRARDRFAELLLDEVAASLAEPTVERVEEELRELDLLEYCKPVLERRRGGVDE